MKILIIIAAAIALPFFLYTFMSLMAALVRVGRGGAAEARDFKRAGVGLRAFLSASVRKQDSGSPIATRAGVSLRSTKDGLRVNETRTIAKDIF